MGIGSLVNEQRGVKECQCLSNARGQYSRKTFHFAVRVVKLSEHLRRQKQEYIISKQLLRSGTAVGAVVREAQNAESKADFIHKFSIAQKECDETRYWLERLKAAGLLGAEAYQNIQGDATELRKIIRTIIVRTKQHNAIHC